MNKLFKRLHILLGMCVFAISFMACSNNSTPQSVIDKELGKIDIKEVRLNGVKCNENKTVETGNTTSELSIRFAEAYEKLSVKVNGCGATMNGKVATAQVKNITEVGILVTIEAIAKGKNKATFSFKAMLKLGEIRATVTFDGKSVAKGAAIETSKTEGNVAITFDEMYESLSVKINGEVATPSGKIASKKISNISEGGTEVRIEATADGKKLFSYNFTLKKLATNEIGIESVIFDGEVCTENATIETEKIEGDVKVTFVEAYTGLQVTINGISVIPMGKVATAQVKNITEAGVDINIEATATGKTKKSYKFKLKRVLPIATIKELTIEAKDISLSSPKDEKTYSETVAPLLSEIAGDGSTKAGDAREPKAVIIIRYHGNPEEQKLKVENTTTNTSQESVSSNWGAIRTPAIELNKGDNHLVITYSEKGKKDLVYKLIVGYVEPEYEPISFISINQKEYKTKEELEKLIAGTENLSVDGQASVKVGVIMPEIWFKEDGWNIKIDGSVCQRSEFQKIGYGDYIYKLDKNVLLSEGGVKVLKIEFENTARSYKKEYKANITHLIVNKLKSLVLINSMDPAKKKEIASRNHMSYSFDGLTYSGSLHFDIEDRMEKAFFIIEAQDEQVQAQYYISATNVATNQITSWQSLTKEAVSYIDYNHADVTVNAYSIKDVVMKHGSNFLYISLEKGSSKTYYVQEIKREKLPANNTSQDYIRTIYQDADGNEIDYKSPISEKGLIRVLPKSPRATVELLTPQAKFFTKASDGWHECQIDLTEKTTFFSYNIVAEDGITKRLFENEYLQTFVKLDAVSEVKFDYKTNGNSWQREHVSEIDGKRYLNIEKTEVKDKKIYLFINAFKGVSLSHPDFTQISAESPYGTYTDYVFEVVVSDIVDSINTNKEYTVPLTLSGKPCGDLKLVILAKDGIIHSIEVRRIPATLLPNGLYICKGDLSSSYYSELTLHLHFIDDEKQNPTATNRAIKIFKNGVEIPMTINQYETRRLEFKNYGFNVNENEKFSLTIQYFEDKTQSLPTKEYTLDVEDI